MARQVAQRLYARMVAENNALRNQAALRLQSAFRVKLAKRTFMQLKIAHEEKIQRELFVSLKKNYCDLSFKFTLF